MKTMNFSSDNNSNRSSNNSNIHQISLPQFSEITSRSNSVTIADFNDISMQLQTSQSGAIYTNASVSNASNQTKQILVNAPNKYPSTIHTWPDPNTLMQQLCEKQGMQTINIPSYSQNSSLLGVQSNSLPVRIIPNVYLPSASTIENNSSKEQHEEVHSNSNTSNSNMDSSRVQQPSVTMAEYLQKLQATTLPLTTLQQLIKLQSEHTKKAKVEEEQTQNILNIPIVPVFRNGNQYMGNSENVATTIAIDPNDLHRESQSENSGSTTSVGSQTTNVKVEQQIQQTDSPKTERKMKFRAKTGEIKVTVGLDGSTLYSCPECSLVFTDKGEVEQHIQAHIQERKYQCKECGAMLKRKEHLDQHMRGHSDERPFKCPVCQKAFKRNEHLTRHYVIHSGDKNFTCTVCQKAFSRKDHLNKHTQTHLGIRKAKMRKDSQFTENKESNFDRVNIETSATTATTTTTSLGKPDVNFLLKDTCFVKQESSSSSSSSFLQHIQNLQKDPNLIQTFSAFKEQTLRDNVIIQQQAVNMNDILPQNTRSRKSNNNSTNDRNNKFLKVSDFKMNDKFHSCFFLTSSLWKK